MSELTALHIQPVFAAISDPIRRHITWRVAQYLGIMLNAFEQGRACEVMTAEMGIPYELDIQLEAFIEL
ncbi:hypothetical protein ASG68_12215 [Rhizobium sp. Leaf453]|nr:hypothetical protein ASG68_12215 [Rhizobium sp. Leaf453]